MFVPAGGEVGTCAKIVRLSSEQKTNNKLNLIML
jgi:hypothetical protein